MITEEVLAVLQNEDIVLDRIALLVDDVELVVVVKLLEYLGDVELGTGGEQYKSVNWKDLVWRAIRQLTSPLTILGHDTSSS